MSSVCVGTSGWGYPSWQPGFYPPGLDRSGFLSYYAERLATVELNATKYRLPSEEQFRSWAEQVPDGFRFAVKAPDGIERRLATFEERVRCLGDRLGCVRVVVERPRDDGFLELLLTEVDLEVDGDTFFPPPAPGAFEEVAREEHVSEDGISYAFVTYSRHPDS